MGDWVILFGKHFFFRRFSQEPLWLLTVIEDDCNFVVVFFFIEGGWGVGWGTYKINV